VIAVLYTQDLMLTIHSKHSVSKHPLLSQSSKQWNIGFQYKSRNTSFAPSQTFCSYQLVNVAANRGQWRN